MTKKITSLCFMLSIAALLSLPTQVVASVSNDQVQSQHIREADGTSGQNTNSGAGVKTGHIQDGAITTNKITDNAVTSQKIADGAITTSDIADGSITDGKIAGPISGSKLGTHNHSGADITDGTLTTSKVADGAITDSKIAGPISGSKISSTGLNADTVDGMHASDLATAIHSHNQTDVNGLTSALNGKADVTHNHDNIYQKKYSGVTVVAKSGGDYTDPVTAMNDLASWCGTPSSNNPCLLKIMPGVYDVSPNGLWLQSYVDIEGSGENMTKLIGGLDGAILNGAYKTEIRYLTVENTGGGNSSWGINGGGGALQGGDGAKTSHITVIARDGGSSGTYGITHFSELRNTTVFVSSSRGGAVNGVQYWTRGTTGLISDGSIIAEGADAGLYIGSACAIKLKNVSITITGGNGIYNQGGLVEITNSDVTSSATGIMNSTTPGWAAKVDHSIIRGGRVCCAKCV